MANPKQLTSQNDVFSLSIPSGKSEAWFFDKGKKDRRKGLALRLRGETRTWVFLHTWGNERKRLTLKPASEMTLQQAREAIDGLNKQSKELSKSPSDIWNAKPEPVAKAITLGEQVPLYLAARNPETAKSDKLRMSERGFVEVKRYLETYWQPLHAMPIGEVTRSHVTKRLDEITEQHGAITSDRARTALSGLYAWLIEGDDKLTNPVMGSRRHGDNDPRERVLSDDELVAIWNATDPKTDYGRIMRLLMLTACRREEISGLRWSEIHGLDSQGAAEIRLPSSRTKNSSPHVAPLSAPAIAILKDMVVRSGREHVFGEGSGGFSGHSRAKARLDQRCGVKDWALHDIRRTVRANLSKLGVVPHVAEAVLNHLPAKLVRTYDPVSRDPYAADKRKALDTWAGHLQTILARSEGANVVPIRA